MRHSPLRTLGFITLPAAVLAVSLTACEKPRAMGEAHSIVATASPDLWFELEERVRTALQPTIVTVTNEQSFLLTHQDPEDTGWNELSRFRNMLVLGHGSEPWVQDVLERYGDDVGDPPALVQVEDVWARGQQVHLVLLPEDEEAPEAFDEILDGLHAQLDQEFRAWAISRMFVSGRDDDLAAALRQDEGFEVTVPEVYRHEPENGVHRFRNDNPSPGELIREMSVSWRSPIPDEVTQDDLLEWRDELVNEYYPSPQETLLDVADFRDVEVNGLSGVELQASWRSPEDAWPGGGPTMTRAIECPDQDRLYLVDAWLYAPNRPKYEYMIQLETLMDTFRCED